MSESILVPGGRDVRGTLDRTDSSACVVACPPHPQHRGDRTDSRLRATSDALAERDIDCLRFDYGPWDGGRGERTDVANAVAWARERYERVGLFGYSFGATLALIVAAETDVRAVSALAPTARLADDLDAVSALDGIDVPTQVIYGARDDTAEWEPVVERARERGFDVVELPADHFFVSNADRIGDLVADFAADAL